MVSLVPRLLCGAGEKSLVYTVCAHSALLGILRIRKYYTTLLFCPSSTTIHCNSMSKDGGAVTRFDKAFVARTSLSSCTYRQKATGSHWETLETTQARYMS